MVIPHSTHVDGCTRSVVGRVWEARVTEESGLVTGRRPIRSIRKGHRYLTIVLNLESGEVLFVGDGKGGRTETVLETAELFGGQGGSGRHRHVAGKAAGIEI